MIAMAVINYAPPARKHPISTKHFTSLMVGYLLLIATAPQAIAGPARNEELIKFIDQYAVKHSAKGEFETTEANKERMSQFVGRQFVIEVPATRGIVLPLIKPLSYDADSQTLTVTLIGNENTQAIRVFDQLSPEAKRIPPAAMLSGAYAKFLLSDSGARKTNEYVGGNAFGAVAKIKVLQSDQHAVTLSNVLDGITAQPLQMKINISADIAQKILPRARWRLTVDTVLMPGQQDFVLDDGLYSGPTIDHPFEVAVTCKTLMAALLRAELFDPQTGTVYAAFGPSNVAQEPQPAR